MLPPNLFGPFPVSPGVKGLSSLQGWENQSVSELISRNVFPKKGIFLGIQSPKITFRGFEKDFVCNAERLQ